MAVTFRAASQTFAASGGTNLTGTEPAGVVSGDVLIACIEVDGANVTKPTGWTDLFGGMVTIGVSRFLVSYIVRGGSAPSYVWAHGASTFDELDIIALKTSGGTIALDSQSSSGATGTTSNHQPDSGSTTAVAASSFAVSIGANAVGANASAIVAPTGYTLNSINTASTDIAMAGKSLSAAGPENPAAFAGFATGTTTGWWDGGTVTFTDVASGVTAAQEIGIFDAQLAGQMVGLQYQ